MNRREFLGVVSATLLASPLLNSIAASRKHAMLRFFKEHEDV